MTKCQAGLNHPDYDETFYRRCPDCPKVDSLPKNPTPRPPETPAADPSSKPSSPAAARSGLGPTKLFWKSSTETTQTPGVGREEIEPVSGWLVAVEGPKQGKAYPLFFGRNSVGRDTAAVVFINDDAISRELLFSLTYDYRLNKYSIATMPNTRALVHLDRRAKYFFDPKNGDPLLNPDGSAVDPDILVGVKEELEGKVELTQEWNWYIYIGNTLLKFVPFFDRMTRWESN